MAVPGRSYSSYWSTRPPHQPQLSGRGGGVAVIYRKDFNCMPVVHGSFTSFEHLGFTVHAKVLVFILVIYRPPKPNSAFIQEFAELVSHFMTRYDEILILGDFTIHVCGPPQSFTSDFLDFGESFYLTQAVQEPTHSKGHILDLVLSSGLSPDNLTVKDIVCQIIKLFYLISFYPKLLLFTAPHWFLTPVQLASFQSCLVLLWLLLTLILTQRSWSPFLTAPASLPWTSSPHSSKRKIQAYTYLIRPGKKPWQIIKKQLKKHELHSFLN